MGSIFQLIIVLIFSVAGSYLINFILNMVAVKSKNSNDIKAEKQEIISQKEIDKQKRFQKED